MLRCAAHSLLCSLRGAARSLPCRLAVLRTCIFIRTCACQAVDARRTAQPAQRAITPPIATALAPSQPGASRGSPALIRRSRSRSGAAARDPAAARPLCGAENVFLLPPGGVCSQALMQIEPDDRPTAMATLAMLRCSRESAVDGSSASQSEPPASASQGACSASQSAAAAASEPRAPFSQLPAVLSLPHSPLHAGVPADADSPGRGGAPGEGSCSESPSGEELRAPTGERHARTVDGSGEAGPGPGGGSLRGSAQQGGSKSTPTRGLVLEHIALQVRPEEG